MERFEKRAKEILKQDQRREIQEKAEVHRMCKLLKDQKKRKDIARRWKNQMERERELTSITAVMTEQEQEKQLEEHMRRVAEIKVEDEP